MIPFNDRCVVDDADSSILTSLPLPLCRIDSFVCVSLLRLVAHSFSVCGCVAILSTYGVDPTRFFLLRTGGIASDGDYTDEGVLTALNAYACVLIALVMCLESVMLMELCYVLGDSPRGESVFRGWL